MGGSMATAHAAVTTRVFLTARWLDLLLLNYEVDAALLLPHVPAGTELDQWEGRAIVSVVGFHFADTRVLGLAIPGHRAFEEVNLRFYVRRGRSPQPERWSRPKTRES